MSNSAPNIVLTSLDFNAYKTSLRNYLQSQSQFQDYNFEASNLSVLLDLLSYNTYLNAFYMNMIGSEMFLDTAKLRDSVVLRAKELNYTPRSFRGAIAQVNIQVTGDPNNVLLTIPAGTSFTAKSGSNNYTFSTQENIVVTGSNGVFLAQNVSIIEGTSVTDTFIIQPYSNTQPQQFTLSNPTIDTTTLSVVSVENNGSNVVPYQQSQTLLDLRSDSAVYFLQGGENDQYQIVFGDNVVGRRPPDYSVVVAEYNVTNGQLPNGLSLFVPNSRIGGYSNIVVTCISPAAGGDISEDISSIKFNAPRYYATQERAVTTSDYETLLKITFPEIEAINVYGGDTLDPPQYGSVYIALKLYNFDFIPSSKIIEYTNFLSSRADLTITPRFVEPSYLYASVSSIVKYNVNISPLQPADIAAYVTSAVQTYSLENLENFGVTLYYSKLVEAIDNTNPAIVSNQTEYSLMYKLRPTLGAAFNYLLSYYTALSNADPALSASYSSNIGTTIYSSQFTYNGLQCYINDDGNGNLRIVQNNSAGTINAITNIGTVDYTTGTVTLRNFAPTAYVGDSIRIYAKLPYNIKDYTSSKNVILEIPNDEINLSIQQVSL